MKKTLINIIMISILVSCNNQKPSNNQSLPPAFIPTINYSVIKYYPHDTTLFTEGLLIHNGQIFESTGSPKELPQTKSQIGIIDTVTGKMNVKIKLDNAEYFGEGIVFLRNKLYQLTYKNNIGFIYDAKSFKQLGTFHFSNQEGWALTTDGVSLIMSDGTDKLTFLDPDNLRPIKMLSVTENGIPVEYLNELEYVKGFIYANVWKTDIILKIDLNNGKVTEQMDLSSLTQQERTGNPNADVLNGIAYDSLLNKFYVTGKLWSKIYQIAVSN